MFANKAILDHAAIDHVQKDFTAWVANKPAFHVLQVIIILLCKTLMTLSAIMVIIINKHKLAIIILIELTYI